MSSNKDNIDHLISEICKKIPVNRSIAEKILKRTNYNVHQTEYIWKTDLENTFATRVQTTTQQAKELLQQTGYNFAKAIVAYKEEYLTVVQRIIESSKKEEEVIANLCFYISDIVPDGVWFATKELQQLPEHIRNILTAWQWYAYYNYEGVSVEQSITNDVIKIIDSEFGLKKLSKDIEKLKTITDKFNRDNPFKETDTNVYFQLRNNLTSSDEYSLTIDRIELAENSVMRNMYQYLCKNSDTINIQIKHITNICK
jgi:hypothetical protein